MNQIEVKGPKPDVVALQRAGTTPYPEVAERLIGIVGPRIVAFIGGVKDTRTVQAWAGGGKIPHEAQRRLQIAYACALTLFERFHDESRVASWFTWLNDMLDDASPAGFIAGAETDDEIEQRGVRMLQAARRALVE